MMVRRAGANLTDSSLSSSVRPARMLAPSGDSLLLLLLLLHDSASRTPATPTSSRRSSPTCSPTRSTRYRISPPHSMEPLPLLALIQCTLVRSDGGWGIRSSIRRASRPSSPRPSRPPPRARRPRRPPSCRSRSSLTSRPRHLPNLSRPRYASRTCSGGSGGISVRALSRLIRADRDQSRALSCDAVSVSNDNDERCVRLGCFDGRCAAREHTG